MTSSILDSCKRDGYWGGNDNWLMNFNSETADACIDACERHNLCFYAAFVRVAEQCILYKQDNFVLTEDTNSLLYAKICPPSGKMIKIGSAGPASAIGSVSDCSPRGRKFISAQQRNQACTQTFERGVCANLRVFTTGGVRILRKF